MKKLYSLLLTLLLLSSCRTPQVVVMPESHSRDSEHLSVYTRADSIREYVHDSISIRMVSGIAGKSGIAALPPDTVYVDRWHTAYKDRWHTLSHTDTITVHTVDSVPIPVEVPVEVEKPPNGFYKFSAGFTIVALLLFIIVTALRLLR